MANVVAIFVLLLAAYGWHAWYGQEARGRQLDAGRRRHGQPRQRALPPPPHDADEEGSV